MKFIHSLRTNFATSCPSNPLPTQNKLGWFESQPAVSAVSACAVQLPTSMMKLVTASVTIFDTMLFSVPYAFVSDNSQATVGRQIHLVFQFEYELGLGSPPRTTTTTIVIWAWPIGCTKTSISSSTTPTGSSFGDDSRTDNTPILLSRPTA